MSNFSSMSLGWNDAILLITLLYSALDIGSDWDAFNTCRRPLHKWLIVSYVTVIGFRSAQLIGMWINSKSSQDSVGDFMLNFRQQGLAAKALYGFMWLLALPFFICWTGLGSFWLWDTVQHKEKCTPMDSHLWFIVSWQALSYVLIIIYIGLGAVAYLLERRVRSAEGNLRLIEDADVISRWGNVSQLSGYTALTNATRAPGKDGPPPGLSPADIAALVPAPQTLGPETGTGHCEDVDCSICLDPLQAGDQVRTLGSCGHVFHKACIDLWLLRRADCPLCKNQVCTPCKQEAAPPSMAYSASAACRQRSWFGSTWAETVVTV